MSRRRVERSQPGLGRVIHRHPRLRHEPSGYGIGVGMLIAVLGVVAVVVTVAAFMFTRKHPENAADGAGERGGTDFFGDVTDRPAGPGAEADGVPERGQPAPGPSAESLPPPGSVGGGDPEGRRPDHR